MKWEPFDERDGDGLNYLTHRIFNEINSISKQGTMLAYVEGRLPVIRLKLQKLEEFHLEYLIYFFLYESLFYECLFN